MGLDVIGKALFDSIGHPILVAGLLLLGIIVILISGGASIDVAAPVIFVTILLLGATLGPVGNPIMQGAGYLPTWVSLIALIAIGAAFAWALFVWVRR